MTPTTAQIKQSLGPGPYGVVVCHFAAEPQYIATAIGSLSLAAHEWQPLLGVSKLGADILYAAPTTSQNPMFTIPDVELNATLKTLTTNCDPSSATFGLPERTAEKGVAFKYVDNSRDATKGAIEPLVLFIQDRIASIRAALSGPRGIAEAREEYEKMTPQAFKVFFKNYRAEMARLYPGMGWKTIECPVPVSETNCEACGKAEGANEEGKAVLRCGRCRKVRYCGRSCQAEDWKAHQPFCPK